MNAIARLDRCRPSFILRSTFGRSAVVFVSFVGALAGLLSDPQRALASSSCGPSGGVTVCVTAPDVLTAEQNVTVTLTPNKGRLIMRWVPSTGPAVTLMTQTDPAPSTNDYSFVWPTQKYIDASGTLQAFVGSTGSTPVSVVATLVNGNITDFQHSPSNWQDSLPPEVWTGPADPVMAAVGDGPDGGTKARDVAHSIQTANPDLFLFLGDVYEEGTFTENRSHYGASALDDPATATLWGTLAAKTQPTVGNHEFPNLLAWSDYWHQRPDYTSFTFAGVLFFDLDSSAPMTATSAQYAYVRSVLATNTKPCIATFWHIPVTTNIGGTKGSIKPMWSLLSNSGGDLMLVGHNHTMAEYVPLNANVQVGGHMVQLLNGAGGHKSKKSNSSDPRIAWQLVNATGIVYVTLNGGAAGGAVTGFSWTFKKTDGTPLRSGSVTC
jgi:hypothetical protein